MWSKRFVCSVVRRCEVDKEELLAQMNDAWHANANNDGPKSAQCGSRGELVKSWYIRCSGSRHGCDNRCWVGPTNQTPTGAWAAWDTPMRAARLQKERGCE
jgi:hypothetical protein